jgi:hypothetical protein
VTVVKRSYGPGEANDYVSGGPPATRDEVSITSDGRRLDSAEAVIAFFDELEEMRVQAPGPGHRMRRRCQG